MAKLSDKELKQIVQRDLGGKYTSIKRAPAAAPPPVTADAVTPPLDQLKEHYAPGRTEATAAPPPKDTSFADSFHFASRNLDPQEPSADAADDVEDAVLTIQPEPEPGARGHGVGPKTVIVSGTRKKVIGIQG